MSLSTSSSDAAGTSHAARTFPSALALAIAVGVVLEYGVFRHAYMLADRSTLAITFKALRLEQGHDDRVVIIGPSTALAIDARRLQKTAADRISVYNYALPNLGTNEQYYFILKKYLRFNRKPDLLVLALAPDLILNGDADETTDLIREMQRGRFRRFFGPTFLLTDVVPETRDWSFAAEAATTLLPSVNYRSFIKNVTFAAERGETWDWQEIGTTRSLLDRNRRIVERIESTNGQLVYNGDRIVERIEVERTLAAERLRRPSTASFVEDVIRLASSQGIPTRLFFTPVCCELETYLSRIGTWEQLARLVSEYEQRYPTFRFMAVGPRSLGQEYFGDPIHVNERGADRLNAELGTSFSAMLASADDGGDSLVTR